MIAFVRELSAELGRCEGPSTQRVAINAKNAKKQHGRVVAALKELHATVEPLPALPDIETSVLVGDIAVLLPETGIVARPASASRLDEIASIVSTLGQHRPVQSIVDPGMLDAGDVLKVGNTIFVAESRRTNADGIAQLRDIVAAHGYNVRVMPLSDGPRLRSACSFVPPHFLVVNPVWVDASAFPNVIVLPVHESEPHAANTLTVGRTTLVSATTPQTEKKLNAAGVATVRVDISEFEKLDAGLSSLVVLLEPRSTNHAAAEIGLMPVQASGVPSSDGHSSQAVVHGGFVFTSPVLPFDPAAGKPPRLSVEEQIEQMIRNLALVLAASGSGLGRVVRTTVHVADPKHAARIDPAWARMFGDHRPARAIVANSALPAGVLVSVEAVAAVDARPA